MRELLWQRKWRLLTVLALPAYLLWSELQPRVFADWFACAVILFVVVVPFTFLVLTDEA